MPKIYKKHSSKFKAKVALEAIKEQRPLGELSKEYSVASSQISTWKKTAEENLSSLFETKHEVNHQTEIDRLHQILVNSAGFWSKNKHGWKRSMDR